MSDWKARAERAEAALAKVNEIRNSIVGAQAVNWSEHVYPLVAALDAAGLEGLGYEEARRSVGTALERAQRAEAQLSALREAVERALLCGALRLVDTPEEAAAARALETATYDAGAAAEAHDREVEARALAEAADAIEERGEATRHPSQIGPTAWNPSGTVLTDAGAARCDEARWLRARAAERRGR